MTSSQGELFAPLYRFDGDYLPAVVGATGGADPVSQLGAMALRARGQLWWHYAKVTASLALSSLWIFLFGQRSHLKFHS